MNKKFLIISIFLLISVSLVVADEDCTGGVPSVYYNGLYWAWASPCSGGCSYATPELYGNDQYGWRYVSGEEEWALRPDKSAFGAGDVSSLCAASFFDPIHDHCDYVNDPVYVHDGSYNELWFVNDCQEGPVNGGDVPEFTLIGSAIIIAGAVGFLIFRKK